MGTSIKNIKLEFSCPAKWDEMENFGNGRYCSHCSQIVYDFTNSKVQEFQKILAENGNNVCGRYTKTQIAPTTSSGTKWTKWLSAAVMFLGINLWNSKARAQTYLDAIYPVEKSHAVVDTEFYMGKAFIKGMINTGRIDKGPEFPGGEKALNDFVLKNVDKTKRLKTGSVYFKVTINANGRLSDFLSDYGLGKENYDEALRILRLMPKWKPAMLNGKAVSVDYILPITFRETADLNN